jgi:iron-sulfur cluster repair protein YtfE (RIC family)
VGAEASPHRFPLGKSGYGDREENMKGEDKQVDPLKRMIKDHEEVSEYLEYLKEALDFLAQKESYDKLKAMKEFFQRNVTAHFKFEEEAIFPALLVGFATQEVIKLILELQREHGTILKELEEFYKITSEIFSGAERTEELLALGKKLLDNLLGHAKKEDKKLLPILKEHRHLLQAQENI